MYNFPTEKDYEGLPEKRIQRIKDNFSDDDSWAFRFLKFHIKAKDFRQLLIETFPENKDSTLYTTLYQVTRDEKSRVAYSIMFMCRDFIPPLYWYYNWKDDLPEATKYKKIYNTMTVDLMGKETLGHIELKKLISQYGINHITEALELKLNASVIKNTLYKRIRPSGIVSFKSLPSFDTISALKDYIKPDLWYIFPEEVI